MKKTKQIAILISFFAIIFGFGLTHFLLPDKAQSDVERRKLAQAPRLDAKAVFSRSYMQDVESYLLDQFPARNTLRTLKAGTRLFALGQKDNNGIYLCNGSIGKLEYPLKSDQVAYAAKKINSITQRYLQGMPVYYAIVPDKNYFMAAPNGYPSMDYAFLAAELRAQVNADISSIDLYDSLSQENYYRTDTHWRQEQLFGVVQTLGEGMGFADALPGKEVYTSHSLAPFQGVYLGQSALPLAPDTLTYLTSAAIQSATVTGPEFEGARPVYLPELFAGKDGYDVFLSGPQAVLTIESPNAATQKELIVFRDSFGSSLAPLLLDTYAKITLVDLRYISSDLLASYVSFEQQDVLFLYSTLILNSGMLLK